MGYDEKARDFWTSTGAAAASGGTTVTKAAVAGETHVVTSFDVSDDAAALVTVESPASTVIWRKRFAAAFNTNATFHPGVLKGAESQAVVLRVSASTANVEANLSGITV